MQRRTGSAKRGFVAPDLQEERDKLAFDQEELSVFFAGGEERANKWRGIVDAFGADPQLTNYVEFADFTPHEMQEDLWKRIRVLMQKHPELIRKNIMTPPVVDFMGYFQGLMPGLGLTVSMFRLSVENLGNDEQKAMWLPMIQNLDIFGCYAQTELGHGSNVAGLLTTATLDKATDEFIINTPCIEATKYWPGDLGRFSSHAVVFARLIIDEEDQGIQPFMVQIRDVETWKMRSGINCGDLGPKIGYNSKDNGWCSFDKVRIPRTNMLMGICDITKEGEMSLKGDPRVLYSVMMGIRAGIVNGCGLYFTVQAARNAMRYCSVRRQFKTEQGSTEERKVLDYQTTTTTLAKMLARGITMAVAAGFTAKEYQLMMDDIQTKKFHRMDPMHHMLSGFKALFSNQSLIDVEEARRTCGGAGYQSFSGFTQLFSGVSPIPTYEGDNMVMLGQASRYLVKLLKKASEGKKLAYPFTYLMNMPETLSLRNQGRTVEDFLNLDMLDRALQARACNMIEATMMDYNASTFSSKYKDNDQFQQAKVTMTVAHLRYLQFHIFRTECHEANFKDPRISKLMELVGKVFCLEQLLEDGAGAYDSGYLASGTYRTMQRAMEQAIKELRPQMIPLGETPYFPDHVVPSTIANRFGDIYEMQLEYAQKSRLNVDNEVPEYFERLMKPILKAKLPKL